LFFCDQLTEYQLLSAKAGRLDRFFHLTYMIFIQGQNINQTQLFPVSLDQSINTDKEMSMIDLFVDSLSIKDFGFRTDFTEKVFS